MFNLRHLQYILAVARFGSISAASRDIGISQPAISSAIKQCEDHFRVQIFFRSPSQALQLTPAGRRFVAKTKAFLDQAADYESYILEMDRRLMGEVRIGCLYPLAPFLLTPIIRNFSSRYPGVSLAIEEGNMVEVIDMLKKGQVDLAITYDAHQETGVEFEQLLETTPSVVMPASDPLAVHDVLPIKALHGRDIILMDSPVAQNYYLNLFARHKVNVKIKHRPKSYEMARALIGAGEGCAIFIFHPKSPQSYDGSELVYRPLKENFQGLTVSLAHAREFPPGRTANAFAEVCRDVLPSEPMIQDRIIRDPVGLTKI